MLKTLHIENIAVIERADVEFSAGLSALTGETGAGKSIIIDSLNAVLGNRVSRELVRSGAERASVTASFESAQAERWCADNEIDAADGEIIVQRRMATDGKSTGRVNGVPVTASQLAKLCLEQLGWKRTTTYTVIKRLGERGILKNENSLVTALVSKDEAQACEIDELVEKKFEGSLPTFIAAFTRRQDLSDRELDEVQQMIDRIRRGDTK